MTAAEQASAVTPSASPSCARSPWLRRALLLGLASGGLWIAGSLSHGTSAQAATARPAPLAPVTSTLNRVVTGLLSQPAHSAAAPISPAAPVAKPVTKPAPPLPVPIVNTVVQQAHSAITTLTDQTLPGTVQQLVSTVDSVLGLPASAGTPIASTPPVALPALPLPISQQLSDQPVQGPVDSAVPSGKTLSDQAYSGLASLLTSAGESAAEVPSLTSAGSTPTSDRPAGAVTAHGPAPIAPADPSPGCPNGGPGSLSTGGQSAMSLVQPTAASTGGTLRILATPAQRAFTPRERASAPAVSPD